MTDYPAPLTQSIDFDDGSITFQINGHPVSINPTDRLFIARLVGAFETIGAI